MTSMGVGIIGCGRMGKERARAAAVAGLPVAVVYDADPERAQALASQYPGCRVASQANLLIRERPLAVFICCPPSAKGPMELEAIDLEVPFLVEKPVGVSALHAEPVRQKLLGSRLVHAVGYQNRCRTGVQHAKKVIAGQSILALSAYWVGKKYLVPWWLRDEDSGGPINEQATHLIDLCRYFCGEIVSVSSHIGDAGQPNSAEGLSAAVSLRFQQGAFASLFYSCQAMDKQISLRIITAAGGVVLSGWDLALTENQIDGTGIGGEAEDIFVKETKQFLAAVQAKQPEAVVCTYEEAWQTQRAVDAIRHNNSASRQVV